jgi:prepilin-type processing-associated H-X9-DG protein
MYAQDADETLPGAGADLPTLLEPYVKNRAVFEGLVYTFPGGSLADVPEPAKAQMGYVPAPGGRILLFVDGHVRFEPGSR